MKKNSGFTLVEILVAVTIAGIVISTVLVGYWQLLKVNHTLDLSRQLQKEAHFALMRMIDKARDNGIDYAAYAAGGACNGVAKTNGKSLCLEGHPFVWDDTKGTLQMNEEPLFSPKFKVKNLTFSVTPESDPFDPMDKDKSHQLQPKVTIFLQVESKSNPNVNIQLQTTVSSRRYDR